MTITGLVRVTVVTPQRRIDLALPEQVSVAEVLPGLLARAGEHLADQGVPDGGWVLRRSDGTELTLGRTLGAHRIRDGELLHLVSRRTEWPELEYDDLVDAVATGSGRSGTLWTHWHTRAAGLGFGAVAGGLGLIGVWRSGPPWPGVALWSLLFAAVLVLAGVLLSRALGDAAAGAVAGVLAMPYGFAGGTLLLAGNRPIGDLGSAQLLTGSAVLMLIGIAGLVGIVDRAGWFAAAIFTGLLGLIAAWLSTTDALDATDVAAMVAGAVLLLIPGLPPMALRLGRVPTPTLPRTTADLVRDDPQPPRPAVYAAVLRAAALLAGMLAACCLVIGVASIVLARAGTRSSAVLVGLVIVGLLLRARSYPITRQRLMLLSSAAAGAGTLAIDRLMLDGDTPFLIAIPVLLAAATLVVLCGLRYSTRVPSPYIGRYAELLEVAVVLAVVPVVCAVLGLYGLARGWGG